MAKKRSRRVSRQILGGEDQAAPTYERSVQIHGTVLNVALNYLNARTAPAIGVNSRAKHPDPRL